MEKRSGQYSIAVIIFLSLSLFSLRFDPEVKELEYGVFSDFVTSIVRDGDLNIINQVKKDQQWLVTSTYNHPTIHDHGISVLWLPFYAYTRLLDVFSVDLDYDKRQGYKPTMVFANLFYFLLIAIASFKAVEFFFNRKLELIDYFIITFGTPYFWYGLVHPSSADLTSAIFPFLYLICHNACLRNVEKKNWYIYGVLLAMGTITKVSLLFYFILPLHYLFVKRGSWLIELKKYILPFLFGCLSIGLPYLCNEWIKYGQLHYSYAGIVANYYLLYETVLGPSGYFIVSPIYLMIIISLIMLAKNREIKNRSFIIFLLFAPILKVLVESFTYAGNAEFGGRHLITDYLAFLLLFPTLYFKEFKKRWIIRSIAIALMIYCVLMGFLYMKNISGGSFSWGMHYELPFQAVSSQWDKFLYFLERVRNGFSFTNLLELSKYFILILLSSISLVEIYRLNISDPVLRKKILHRSTAFLLFVYLLITGLNIVNNERNILALKSQDFFNETVVVNGPEAFHFDDNVGNMIVLLEFSGKRDDQSKVKVVELELDKYIDKVMSQIVIDPIGFKEKLVKRELQPLGF